MIRQKVNGWFDASLVILFVTFYVAIVAAAVIITGLGVFLYRLTGFLFGLLA